MHFTAEDIAPMARGATVLGGGGAGDPYVAEVMLTEALRGGRTIEIVDLADLDPLDEVAPFALVGSPDTLAEQLLGTLEASILFSENPLRKRRPAAVLPYEMAGLNALYPLAVAALLGVPCVDADFVGRGVPSLDLTVLQLDDAQPDSYVLCDPRGRVVTIQQSGMLSVEQLVRPIVETMGWLAVLSTSSLSVEFCRLHALSGTASRCLVLGRLFERLPSLNDSQVSALLAEHGGAIIGAGVVTERLQFNDAIGPRYSLSIEPDDTEEPPLRIELRNEFHLAVRAGEVLASVPDILVVVDRVSWSPLPVEDVTVGRAVCVIALPSDARWRTPKGLRLAGPRSLGYELDYVEFSIPAQCEATR